MEKKSSIIKHFGGANVVLTMFHSFKFIDP
jgi:hypothetical protein